MSVLVWARFAALSRLCAARGRSRSAGARMYGEPTFPVDSEREMCWVRMDSIDSTNSEALRRGAAHQLDPYRMTVVTARQQTAGRGSRGRRWHSPSAEGNLYMSLCSWEPRAMLAQLPLYTHVAALACVGAIDSLASGVGGADDAGRVGDGAVRPVPCASGPGVAVAVKWPNDIIMRDCKVGGILCEADSQISDPCPGRNHVLVVSGIGLNVNMSAAALHSVARPLWPASSLRLCLQSPVPLDVDALAAAVAWRYVRHCAELRAAGYAPIAAALAPRWWGLGRPVRVRGHGDAGSVGAAGPREYDGLLLPPGARGQLRVRTADGSVLEFCAAEIVGWGDTVAAPGAR